MGSPRYNIKEIEKKILFLMRRTLGMYHQLLYVTYISVNHIYHVVYYTPSTYLSGHGTTDCFQIGEGVRQGCILSPCLFNLCAEYIMRNEEAQAGVKIGRRNINNLRYADDTTLMAESEEELKNLLSKVKEESEKVGLKLNIQKTKIMASGPITSWQIDRETVKLADFAFLGSKTTADAD